MSGSTPTSVIIGLGWIFCELLDVKDIRLEQLPSFESSSSLNILKLRKMRHWHGRKTHLILQKTFIFLKDLVLCKVTANCKFYLGHGNCRYENYTKCGKAISCLPYFHALETISPIRKENLSWIIPVWGINFKKNLAFRNQFVWNKCY